jgi:hypothetical protein
MDLDVTRNIFATDENSVISREGNSNGTKMTSSIISCKEPTTYAKMWLAASHQGTISSLPCHCNSNHTCREDCNTMLESAWEGCCCNPNLGFTTKARVCKVMGQEGSPGVTSPAPGSAKKCEKLNLHTPKWTPILRIGVPNGLPN